MWQEVYSLGGKRETEVPGILCPSRDLNIPQEDRPLEQSHLSPGGSLEAEGTNTGWRVLEA